MANTSGLLTQALITLGLVLPAFLGGMFARRRSAADVEVTLSAEARQWAQSFAEGARTAMDEAQRAYERATRAEKQAKNCHDRLDLMEQYIAVLQRIMRERGIAPPTPPWVES